MPTLNSKKIEWTDWHRLWSCLETMGVPSGVISGMAVDGELSSAEVQKVLDIDRNGVLNRYDLKDIKTGQQFRAFTEADVILKRHGVDPIGQIEDDMVNEIGPVEKGDRCRRSSAFLLGPSPSACEYFVPDVFWQKREFLLKLLNKSGYYLIVMPEEYRDDPELVEAAVNNDPDTFYLASERLQKRDPLVKRVRLESISLGRLGFYRTPEGRARDDGRIYFFKEDKYLEPHPPLWNRKHGTDDKHPIVLMIAGRKDWNGAFTKSYEQLLCGREDLNRFSSSLCNKEQEFKAIYYEADFYTDIETILSYVKENHDSCVQQLWFNGHATQKYVEFSYAVDGALRISHFAPHTEELGEIIANAVCDGGEIVFYGCNTGNTSEGENIVDTMAEYVPDSVTVLGSPVLTTLTPTKTRVPLFDSLEPWERMEWYVVKGKKGAKGRVGHKD